MAANIRANADLGPGALVSIFDISGRMEWFFSAYVDALFGLFHKEFELGRGTIFEFTVPFKRVPQLASEQGKGKLLLNIGPNAKSRIHGNTLDGDESLVIRQSGSDVLISGFGVTDQRYPGVTQIIGIGGKGMTQPDQIDRDLIATGDRVAVPQFQGNALARTIVNLDAVIVAGLESASEQPGFGGLLGDELPGGFYGLVDTEI